MAQQHEIEQYLANLKEELNAVEMYSRLASNEKDERLSNIYKRLAEMEQGHVEHWQKKLSEAGVILPKFRPSWRTRVLSWLAAKFGVTTILPTLAAQEDRATVGYSEGSDVAEMAKTERSHARLLRHIGRSMGGRGLEGGALARLEGRHKSAGGNALRAAVLGASDGLLSNFNLVMGVAGAALAGRAILLTGIAGLLAGSISMALGEYISVQSSRELYQKQISMEKQEIESAPEEEAEELVLIYQAQGLDEPSARALAEKVMSNPDTALDALVRDELSIDPEQLGGSAWEAAMTSFLLFAVGAIIPVIPYLFFQEARAVVASAGLSAVALFGVGAAITLFTGRSVLYSGFRQVIFGLAAATATFLVGRLIGIHVST